MRSNRAAGRTLEELDVVFVDDSRLDHGIFRSILSGARVARIRGFVDAVEAHHSMLVDPPHVVVTDLEMPGADGLQLVRSMRDPRSGPLATVPVILVASRPTRDIVTRAIGLGVHHVLAKPLSPSALIRRLEATAADRRRFVLDDRSGLYALEDREALLDGQRRRWKDLLDGVRVAPDRVAAEPEKPAVPTLAEEVRAVRRRLRGFSGIRHDEPSEGATGHGFGGTA